MEVVLGREGSYLDWPDAAVGPGGEPHLACASHGREGSVVEVWALAGPGARRVWSSRQMDGLVWPRIAPAPRAGGLAVAAWTQGTGASAVTVLFPGSDRSAHVAGMAEPCLASTAGGPVFLVGRIDETIVAVPCGPDGLRDPVEVSRPGGRVFSPAAAADGDGGVLVAWEEERSPGCAIVVRRISGDGRAGRLVEVDPDGPTGHAPHAALMADGTMAVAWHAPAAFVPPQHLVKDLRLAILSGDRVMHPAAGMSPDPGEEPRGEDQGFEFPHVVPLARGGIVVLGRSSQGFKMRALGRGGWGEAVRIDPPGWGCRGPGIRAVLTAPGACWAVTRERVGIVARALDVSVCGIEGAPPAGERAVICTGGRGSDLAQARDEPRRDRDGYATWFGDIHQHSAFSDGTGAPHEAYVRCRDFYGDDVTALTDHESFLGKRTPPGEWAYLQDLARRFCVPGRLATLVAYEWTGKAIPGPGHKVVVFPDVGSPLASREDPSSATGSGLLASISASGGMAFPHHVGWTGADERSHREDVQPCMEVVSCHGAYERRDDAVIGRRDPANGPFLRELLGGGMRFGFLGGSDGHGLLWHHGVSRRRDSHRTGLTGFVARDLTREAVVEAIRSRRTFATSGPPMWVRLWADGHPMGSIVRVADPSRVRVEIEVDAGGPIARAALVLAASEIALPAAGPILEHDCTIDAGPGPARFVYLRLERSDGECAWTSPVFVP